MHTIHDALREKKQGNSELASRMIDSLIESDPANSWYKLEAVRLKIEREDYISAKQLIDRSLESKNSRDLFNIYTAGVEYYEATGNFFSAIDMAKGGYDFKKTIHSAIPYLKILQKNGHYGVMNEVFDDFMLTKTQDHEKDLFINRALPIINLQGISDLSFNNAWPSCVNGEVIENACIVMLIKNEEDIIYHAIKNNYNCGFRFFLIIDNNSTDKTKILIDRIKTELPDVLIVVNEDPYPGYKQSFKTTLAANYAKEYFKLFSKNIEWVFPLDADEFICSPVNFGGVLKQVPKDKDLLVFTLRNIAPSAINQIIDLESDVSKIFTFSNNSTIFSNPTVKVAYKHTPNCIISQGNHSVDGLINSRSQIYFLAQNDICINHLPIRSIDQIKAKTINGALAAREVEGGDHWKNRFDFYIKQGDEYFVKPMNNFIAGMSNIPPTYGGRKGR